MGFYTGRTGSLALGSVAVAKIRDWSIDTTVELLSTNDISSGFNTFVPGVKGATGSATLMYYRLGTGEAGTEFTELLAKIMKEGSIIAGADGDLVALTLNVGTGSNDDITFNAYITSANVSVSTGELTVVAINFTVDGDFSQVIAKTA